MKNSKKKTTMESSNGNEVEQLLEAAQEEMMLKLSVDSHMSRVAPNYIHSDLDRRFQALKSRPSIISKPPKQQQQQQKPLPPPPAESVVVDEELKGVLGDDDLAARFAALKASFSSSSSSNKQVSVGPNISDGQHQNDDEDDEVEKLIKWAIDAARLDPSPPSDDDDDEDDTDDDDDDKDSDNDQVIHRKKEHRRRK